MVHTEDVFISSEKVHFNSFYYGNTLKSGHFKLMSNLTLCQHSPRYDECTQWHVDLFPIWPEPGKKMYTALPAVKYTKRDKNPLTWQLTVSWYHFLIIHKKQDNAYWMLKILVLFSVDLKPSWNRLSNQMQYNQDNMEKANKQPQSSFLNTLPKISSVQCHSPCLLDWQPHRLSFVLVGLPCHALCLPDLWPHSLSLLCMKT